MNTKRIVNEKSNRIISITIILLLGICCMISSASAAGGTGVSGDPYIITNATELQAMNSDLTAYYALGNNIDLTGVTWTPIGATGTPFLGNFDGNGYTISKLVISSTTDSNYGLFGVCGSGTQITNFVMDDCSITGTNSSVGLLVGYVVMSSSVHDTMTIEDITIQNCDVDVNLTGDLRGSCVIGYINGYADVECNHILVVDCNFVSASGIYVGGIVGTVNTNSTVRFSDCQVNGSIISASGSIVGGIVGIVTTNSTVLVDSDCRVVQSKITSASGHTVGGIVGFVYTNSTVTVSGIGNVMIENCEISSASGSYVGGIVGFVITNSTVTVTGVGLNENVISASGTNVGGIVGNVYTNSTSNVISCDVENSVIKGSDSVGGVIGRVYGATVEAGSIGNVYDCTVHWCTIVGSSSYVGGVIGKVEKSTYSVDATVVSASCIKGTGYVSGILGGMV